MVPLVQLLQLAFQPPREKVPAGQVAQVPPSANAAVKLCVGACPALDALGLWVGGVPAGRVGVDRARVAPLASAARHACWRLEAVDWARFQAFPGVFRRN